MLRRHRQIRMQIHQLMDACLFAVSFWLSYQLRANEVIIERFNLKDVMPFDKFVWFYLILIPVAPLVLEAQGFYNRPALSPRWTIVWPLFKGCFITTVGLIFVLFFFRLIPARTVVIWFGGISFVLVYAKEEILRTLARSKLAQAQSRRRFIVAGTRNEIERMKRDLQPQKDAGVHVVAELDLNETPAERLVQMLHEHSANGVILSAKHTYFEQVETVIKACEVEGVDA